MGSIGEYYSHAKDKSLESTVMFLSGAPLVTAVETLCTDMSDEVSLRAKVVSAITGIIILPAMAYMRDKSLSYSKKISGVKAGIHDGLFGIVTGFLGTVATKTALYQALGYDGEDILQTGLIMGIGFSIATPVSYYMRDVARGSKQWFSKLKGSSKKKLAIGFTAASLALTAAIYKASPDTLEFSKAIPYEKVIDATKIIYSQVRYIGQEGIEFITGSK